MDEILFEVESPLGHRVTLRRRTWDSHESRRPDISGQLANVALSVREPHLIVRTQDGSYHYYRRGHGSGRTANAYLHVLVRQRGETGFVVATVWFTPELEEGEILWFRTR